MLSLLLSPRIRPLVPVLLVLLSAGLVRSQTAQTADGSTYQTKGGVALIKPQAWSKESEATVYEFEGFYDRASTGAGYYEFHKGADKRQIQVSKIVKIVIYPDPSAVKEVVTSADRQKLAAEIDNIKAVRAKYPVIGAYVDTSIKKMNDELAQFDAGKVKTGGAWVTKSSYDSEKANNLLTLLQNEVASADPPSSFDFANDPKVIALKEMSASNPKVQQTLETLSVSYNKALRKEKRTKLLTRLTEPSLPVNEAQTAVAQLKTLQPDEDPQSKNFIKNWDAAAATAAKAEAQADTISPLIEKELAAAKVTDAPPQLSSDLQKQVDALTETMKQFMATKPAPQLVVASNRALAVSSVGLGFDRLKALFAKHQFIEAKDILDDLANQSRQVGPETTRVVGSLQVYANGKIKEFTTIREEARVLSEAGKQTDALAKYQAAYDVIPDAKVGESIFQIKQALPSPTPAKK